MPFWDRRSRHLIAENEAPRSRERRGILKLLLSAGAIAAAPAARALPLVESAGAESAKAEAGLSLDPVDWVDPNIGGIGHLLTSVAPEVQVPHGVAVISPVVAKDVTDIYLAETMQGFSLGASSVMAATGTARGLSLPIVSDWDHDHDAIRPYYGSYRLESYGIGVEYTAAAHAAHFRFTFPAGSSGIVAFSPVEIGNYRVLGPAAFSGEEELQGVRSYLYVETTLPARVVPVAQKDANPGKAAASGGASALIFEYGSEAGIVEVRAGLSYISADQARRNLDRELGGSSFESAKSKARSTCNSLYSRIRVKGGTERERRLFYTCLYRSCQFMKDITEEEQYRGPFDRRIRPADGRNFYIEDNLWDTYRTRHPLHILLEPQCNSDMLVSYVRMFEESGHMPQFPYMRGDLLYMNGNHAASIFLDSYAKGRRDFDLARAYEGLRKVATSETALPDTRGPATELDKFYYQHGYYPGLRKGETESVKGVNPKMRRQAVSVTLDAAYDDWCLSELAMALGKAEDAAYFAKRAKNYRNVFDRTTGFMAPRSASGEFIQGLNPKWSGGQAGRDYYTECNGWVNTFLVQHDIGGLIGLMGGRQRFVERVDALFAEGYDADLKFLFLSQFPDSTALIGQYPQGNEPAFHIPYLYNYAGAPWKTQKRVRQIMRTWYSDQPLGLPGDDDNGATSAWFVLSAMGFYPVCPGRPYYVLGSPIFEECEIDLEGGKTFRIMARNVSALNKYIQGARLNGEPLDKPWFYHSSLAQGGTLELQMGPEPNKAWGSLPEAAPPETFV
jgi:predicted alpha-1,2-mannosidase